MSLLLSLLCQAGDYLPLEPGAGWVYEVSSENGLAPEAPGSARDVRVEVRGAAALPDGEWTELSNFLGYARCWVRAADDGLELRAEAVEHAPVLPILKPLARPGDTWSGALGTEEVAFTAAGERTMDDGRRALQVDFQVADRARGVLCFERGVGLVKAAITKDLDCHSGSTTVYRLKR
jgi:hypothetical protein